jgi:hypothetical protein
MLLIDGDHLFVYRIGFAIENDPLGLMAAIINIDNAIRDLKNTLKDYSIRIFLTGKDNFRKDIATIFPYKGRRILRRPTYYQEIRDYLVNQYKAEVIDGMEADDALGIEQIKHTKSIRDCPSSMSLEEAEQRGLAYDTVTYSSTIVASDKDLDMIPGNHYNPIKKKKYFVTQFEAVKWFHIQLLTGDWETDSIPGLKGVGTITAQKMLKDCTTEEELRETVYREYLKSVQEVDEGSFTVPLKGGCIAQGDSPEAVVNAVINEVSQLVWIKRE